MVVETIPARLRFHAEGRPLATFCTFLARGQAESIAFSELLERSLAYARFYSRLGIKRGDLILIILQHTPHLFYSYLGAMLAGAVPSFMPFPSPKQRAEFYWADHEILIDRIKPRLIVSYAANLEAARATIPGFDTPAAVASDEILTDPGDGLSFTPDGFSSSADDVACMQHSSGTTSLKKGVVLTHRAILGEVEAYSKAIGFGAADRIASWLPLYHDMGFIACFMRSVIEGTHLIALDPFEWTMRPSLLLDAIERYRATLCWLPNFAFSHIVNTSRGEGTPDLSSMRAFINCSEPCKAHTFERFAERFGGAGITPEKLHVSYAMAENVFGVTQTVLGRPVRVLSVDPDAFSRGRVELAHGSYALSLLSCGPPIDGVRLRICDPSGNEVAVDGIGEIHVSSPFLFDGYYRLPEKTAERMRGAWFATGDMGFLLDGELFVTGRIDDMLIVNGRNYYSHEIEAAVNGVNGVLPGRSVAISAEDERADATVVVVLVETAPGCDVARLGSEVRKRVAERLGLGIHAVVPVAPGRLVKTTSGKISRNKNRELFVEGAFS